MGRKRVHRALRDLDRERHANDLLPCSVLVRRADRRVPKALGDLLVELGYLGHGESVEPVVTTLRSIWMQLGQ